MKKKIGAFGAGYFSLGTLVEGRPGTTIFQNPGGGGRGLGGVAYKDPAQLPPRGRYRHTKTCSFDNVSNCPKRCIRNTAMSSLDLSIASCRAVCPAPLRASASSGLRAEHTSCTHAKLLGTAAAKCSAVAPSDLAAEQLRHRGAQDLGEVVAHLHALRTRGRSSTRQR